MLLNRMNRVTFAGVALILAFSSACVMAAGVTEHKLPNGLTVLLKEAHAAPVITAQVWFKVGSKNEHTGITGVSHLLEHMLFKTSKNYKEGEITKLVRERGGVDNAATWTDFTYYWELLSSEHMDFALKTLAEKVQNALLLGSEFAKERVVVLSEMEGRENDPDQLVYRAMDATAYMAHPYRWPVIGWRSDVSNVPVSALRSYYKEHYGPENATLVIVGDFDSKPVLELIKKHFGPIPGRVKPAAPYTVEPVQHGEKTVIVRREGSAERVMLGYHTPGLEDPDTYALTVLDQILSGGRSSRLFQALVDKQLASAAWSSAGGQKDPTLFTLGATGRQGVKTEVLEKALLEQVEAAKSAPPSDEEMQSAKNQLEAYLVFQNDSVSDQGEQLGYYNTVAKSWKYLETLVPRIKAVTPEQVQAVAKKYFTSDNLTIAKFIPTGLDGNGATPAGGGKGPIRSAPRQHYYEIPHGVGAKTAAAGSPSSAAAKTNGTRRATRVVLDNGMVVIAQQNRSNPTVAVVANFEAGDYFDPAEKKGTAAMVAEMMSRGTKTRTALQIAREIERVGASLSGSASTENARFRGKSLSKDLPLLLDLLNDELRNSTFPEAEFPKVLGQAISGVEESRESTEDQAMRRFYNVVYPPGHPYHRLNIEDERKNLESITRDDLVAFHSKYYRPDTAVVAIVGDVEPAKAVEMIKQRFADWKAEGAKPVMEIPTVPLQSEPKTEVINMPDKSEATIVFGHASPLKRKDKDYYAFRLANQVLGGAGALASILGDEIREKSGLAYDVYSTFDAGRGAGPWWAGLGVNPVNVDKSIGMLKSEMTKFAKTGATKKQFEDARNFMIGYFPIALETNSGLANMLVNAEFYGLGLDYIRDFAKIYRSVTLEQANAAARKYLHPDKSTLVIAGPYSK